MMNIQAPIATRFITTHLARVIVALLCSAFLSSPVWSIGGWISRSASPVGIILATAFNGCSSILTIGRTESTTSQSFLVSCSLVIPTAVLAFQRKVYLWLYCAWSWLPCGELRSTLARAKAGLSVSPLYEFFLTPVTSKGTLLTWVYPTFVSARIRTKVFGYMSTLWISTRESKSFSTVSAFLNHGLIVQDSTRLVNLSKGPLPRLP